jgi:hypothetical protein
MSELLANVQEVALHFHDDLQTMMLSENKEISELRVRVIGFRDFFYGDAPALEVSDFFQLPEQNIEFAEFVGDLRASGGGDNPESALEALSLAIKSDWRFGGAKRRHVITLWTDDAAHDLQEAKYRPLMHDYPSADIARSLEELSTWWLDRHIIDQDGRRLVLFAPTLHPWDKIFRQWEETMHFPSEAGDGLQNTDYTRIMASIAKSLTKVA